jgi:hypothetical protein
MWLTESLPRLTPDLRIELLGAILAGFAVSFAVTWTSRVSLAVLALRQQLAVLRESVGDRC